MNQDGSEMTLANWWRRYAERRRSAEDHQLRMFVRSLRPASGSHGRRERRLERLHEAERRGRIDGFDVLVTGEELCLCDRCQELTPRGTVREAVLELAGGESERPTPTGFERREVNCSFTGEEYHVLVPPETALGVYLDGEPAGLFPCTAGGVQYPVETFLDTLVEGRSPAETPLVGGPQLSGPSSVFPGHGERPRPPR